MGIVERIREWYCGEMKLLIHDNPPDSPVWVAPMPYVEHHWSAKALRAFVAFYLRHWQWIWSTVIAVTSLYVAALALK